MRLCGPLRVLRWRRTNYDGEALVLQRRMATSRTITEDEQRRMMSVTPQIDSRMRGFPVFHFGLGLARQLNATTVLGDR